MTRVKIARPKRMSIAAGRPHHRTSIITTTRKEFNRVAKLKEGETLDIECPNDIISSTRSGNGVVHHTLRRVSLLRRQLAGGYRKVKVRWEQGNEISCVIAGRIIGDDDACSCKVRVSR